MRKELAAIVCCPVHKTRLALDVAQSDASGDILAGTLRCGTCRFDYPIEAGIPNLLPPEYHVDEVATAKPKATAPPGRGKGKTKAAS